MSIISAIDVGERSRGVLGIREGHTIDPARAYVAMRGNRKPMAGHNVLNPGAIRAAAAQAAIEERKVALLERDQALREQIAQDRTAESRLKLQQDERQRSFERDMAISAEKERALTGAQDRYHKDIKGMRDADTYDRAKDLQARKDNLGQLMQGLYGRNPGLVKDWVNKYGNPNAKIQGIEFADPNTDPKNPEGAIITYENGSKSYFKDNKDLYQGFLAWLDPNIEERLSKERMKKEELESKERIAGAKSKLTAEKYAKIHSDAVKAYDKLYPIDKLTGKRADDAPDVNDYVKAYKEHAIEQAITAEGAAKPEAKPEGGPGGGYAEFKSPDGRVKRQYADGRIEILKDGKVIAAKDKTGNVINPGPREAHAATPPTRKGSTVDYGTGEMTPEGEAEIEEAARAKTEAKDKEGRKSAIPQKGEERKATGTAEYTDKSTGHQMRVTVYSDGTTKTERIESKKKRKTKKDGDSDSDNSGDSGGNGG